MFTPTYHGKVVPHDSIQRLYVSSKKSILPFSEIFEKINSAEVIINDASSNHFPIAMNSSASKQSLLTSGSAT